MAGIEDRLEELESRIKALEAERGILQTMHKYGHTWDYGPVEERLDCFTDDAVVNLIRKHAGVGDEEEVRYSGRDELLAKWIGPHIMAPQAYFKHVMVEPRITLISDDEARVQSMFCVLYNRDGVPYVSNYGRYFDHLRKCGDGVWRFKEKVAEVEVHKMDPGAGLVPGGHAFARASGGG
jgi:hypothetical protein